ncbi:hypothetical protein [Streptomyces sp. WG7]|uniref:hypothetical protein n=1 Tax=Streptomyces sp. WG7 TaxID=3417650 RepID=UPI003CF610D2
MTRTWETTGITDAARARVTTARPAATRGAPPLEDTLPAAPHTSRPTRPTRDGTTSAGPVPTPLDRP